MGFFQFKKKRKNKLKQEEREAAYSELYESQLGEVQVEEKDEYKLFKYEKDGEFNRDAYRKLQDQGSRDLPDMVWTTRENIRHFAEYVDRKTGPVSFGICHGVKHGREVSWFIEDLKGSPEVVGTDIADRSDQFENVVRWDFHERNPEWHEKADFVYSNSWDHAHDPEKAIRAWMDSLQPGGVMLFEWSESHAPEAATVLDPFGITVSGLVEFLNTIGGDQYYVDDVLEDLPAHDRNEKLVVFKRRA